MTNPVPTISPSADPEPAAANLRRVGSEHPQAQRRPVPPTSGSQPNREIRDVPKEPRTFEMPQDEVQVQRDGEGSGQIVIKYLDHSGQVILQVPSSQLLDLARAIEQALDDQARKRGPAKSLE